MSLKRKVRHRPGTHARPAPGGPEPGTREDVNAVFP